MRATEKHEVVRFPAKEHPEGSTLRCQYIDIPQVAKTHAIILSRVSLFVLKQHFLKCHTRYFLWKININDQDFLRGRTTVLLLSYVGVTFTRLFGSLFN
jgi:hypothetical protein